MNGINLVDMALNFRQQKEVQTEEKYYSNSNCSFSKLIQFWVVQR